MSNKDKTPLTFGKYKGQTPEEIADNDPGYVVWMYDNIRNVSWLKTARPCSRKLRDLCEMDESDALREILGFGWEGHEDE